MGRRDRMTSRIPEPDSEPEREGIQDLGDTLAAKEVTGDAQEGYVPPRDYPVAADEYGTTSAEQARGEGLTGRLRRERPDVPSRNDVGGSAAASEGNPFADDVGRISEDQDAVLRDRDTDMFVTDRGKAGGGFSAEESALHLTEEP